jgi:hypothetical protein
LLSSQTESVSRGALVQEFEAPSVNTTFAAPSRLQCHTPSDSRSNFEKKLAWTQTGARLFARKRRVRLRVMASVSNRGWRRILACLLAYTLVLQAFVFAVEIGHAAAGPADGSAAWAGFELCSHHSDGAVSPDAPAQAPVDCLHCQFCIAGAVYLGCAPPSIPPFSTIIFTVAAWSLARPQLPVLFANESARPRGPPVAV